VCRYRNQRKRDLLAALSLILLVVASCARQPETSTEELYRQANLGLQGFGSRQYHSDSRFLAPGVTSVINPALCGNQISAPQVEVGLSIQFFGGVSGCRAQLATTNRTTTALLVNSRFRGFDICTRKISTDGDPRAKRSSVQAARDTRDQKLSHKDAAEAVEALITFPLMTALGWSVWISRHGGHDVALTSGICRLPG